MALTEIKTSGIADDAITTDKLANAINTERTANTAKVSLGADSVTGAKIADDAVGAEHIEVLDAALQFGDSVKAQFGTGNDLEIYHNGNDSFITHNLAGSGNNLHIEAANSIQFGNVGTSEVLAQMVPNGACTLWYDNSKKLSTVSTGVKIENAGNNRVLKLDHTDGDYCYITFMDDDTSDDGQVRVGAKNNELLFLAGGSERLRIDTNGHVAITSGNLEFANGAGIDFSNNPDGSRSIGTDGNKFDDYEEGTWTPTSRDGTLAYARANYTKIGRMVHVSAYVDTFSDTSTNDSLTIQNLPFSPSVGDVAVGSVLYGEVSDANKTVVYLHNSRGGFIFHGGNSGGYDTVRYNELNGSSSFYFQATYFA